jgi:hypothetical protein
MSRKKQKNHRRAPAPASLPPVQLTSAVDVARQLSGGESEASKYALAAFCKMNEPQTESLKDWPPIAHLATVLRVYGMLPYYQSDTVTQEHNAQFSLEVLGALTAMGANKRVVCEGSAHR